MADTGISEEVLQRRRFLVNGCQPEVTGVLPLARLDLVKPEILRALLKGRALRHIYFYFY